MHWGRSQALHAYFLCRAIIHLRLLFLIFYLSAPGPGPCPERSLHIRFLFSWWSLQWLRRLLSQHSLSAPGWKRFRRQRYLPDAVRLFLSHCPQYCLHCHRQYCCPMAPLFLSGFPPHLSPQVFHLRGQHRFCLKDPCCHLLYLLRISGTFFV